MKNSGINSQLLVHTLDLGEAVVDLLVDCGDFLPIFLRENAHLGKRPRVALNLRAKLNLVLQTFDEKFLCRLACFHRFLVVCLRARRLCLFGR